MYAQSNSLPNWRWAKHDLTSAHIKGVSLPTLAVVQFLVSFVQFSLVPKEFRSRMYGKVTLCVVFPYENGYFGGRLMVSHPFLF